MKEMKRIAMIYDGEKFEAKKMAEKIRGRISLEPGYRVYQTLSRNTLEKGLDAVLIFGGDGLLLYIADRISQSGKEIPIVGINYGFRGYLCWIQPDEVKEKIEQILQGDFEIEKRTRIQAEIFRKTEADSKPIKTIDALNEIVIGGIFKMVSLDIKINNGDKTIGSFIRGDGVIISTKTGSTGYNRNAGGKVIGTDNFVITANNPVLDDSFRSWLTREKSVVFSTETIFEIHSRTKKKANLPFIVGDGQRYHRLKVDEYITLKKSPRETLFIKF